MAPPFVAVAASPVRPEVRTALLAAGASAVLNWPALTDPYDDDTLAVLLDQTLDAELVDDVALTAVLRALTQLDGALDPANGSPGAVIVSTRPVTDTLKLVDVESALTGTAERDQHRFVGPPIAVRLRLLRSVTDTAPDLVAILTALTAHGATLIGLPG